MNKQTIICGGSLYGASWAYQLEGISVGGMTDEDAINLICEIVGIDHRVLIEPPDGWYTLDAGAIVRRGPAEPKPPKGRADANCAGDTLYGRRRPLSDARQGRRALRRTQRATPARARIPARVVDGARLRRRLAQAARARAPRRAAMSRVRAHRPRDGGERSRPYRLAQGWRRRRAR